MHEAIKQLIKIYETNGYNAVQKEFNDIQNKFSSYDDKQIAQIRLLMAKLCIVENKVNDINNYFSVGLKTKEKEEYDQLKEKQRLLEIELAEKKRKENRREGIFVKEDFIDLDGNQILKNYVSWDEFNSLVYKNYESTYKSGSISLDEALNYCRTLSTKLKKEVRLPYKSEIEKNCKKLQFDENPSVFEWCIDQPGKSADWRTVINKNLRTYTAKQYGTFYQSGVSAQKMCFRFVIVGN